MTIKKNTRRFANGQSLPAPLTNEEWAKIKGQSGLPDKARPEIEKLLAWNVRMTKTFRKSELIRKDLQKIQKAATALQNSLVRTGNQSKRLPTDLLASFETIRQVLPADMPLCTDGLDDLKLSIWHLALQCELAMKKCRSKRHHRTFRLKMLVSDLDSTLRRYTEMPLVRSRKRFNPRSKGVGRDFVQSILTILKRLDPTFQRPGPGSIEGAIRYSQSNWNENLEKIRGEIIRSFTA